MKLITKLNEVIVTKRTGRSMWENVRMMTMKRASMKRMMMRMSRKEMCADGCHRCKMVTEDEKKSSVIMVNCLL